MLQCFESGSVSEWLKEHAWNACMRETVSEVRILSLPPSNENEAKASIFIA